MHQLFYIMIAFTTFCGVSSLTLIMLTFRSRATSQRVRRVTEAQYPEEQEVMLLLKMRTTLYTFIRWLRSHISTSENSLLLQRFTQVGTRSGFYRDVYTISRVLGPVIALGAGSLVQPHRALWMVTLAGIFYLIPDMLLRRLIYQRRKNIRLSIPDAIDLLVICVDAGLGIDQAMLRVGQELCKVHPDIYEEFLQINREQRAGKLRLAAWQEMARRNDLPDLNSLVNMLMQTERFGTPIARALCTFAEDIRQKRRQKAEEMAAKTTVKIIFPLVLCIFPSMFIVLLGPAAISIARSFTGFGQ